MSPDRDLSLALETARQRYPKADFLGCSTAGELTEAGPISGGVSCLLVSWGRAAHRVTRPTKLGNNSAVVLEQLCHGLDRPSGPESTCMMFGNGLSTGFEKLVAEVRRSSEWPRRVVGAGAGDGRAFQRTAVGVNGQVITDGVVGVEIHADFPIGLGMGGGSRVLSPEMWVTKAADNVIYEIDNTPALEIYRRFALRRGVELNDSNVKPFLIQHELGILLFEDLIGVRAPIEILPGGALLFAGQVPEGSRVTIVDCPAEDALSAARTAAMQARADIVDDTVAGVLVFSCIGRKLALGERFGEEMAAIASVFPETPVAGFVSYSEIAETTSSLSAYHNLTVVVAAIPANV